MKNDIVRCRCIDMSVDGHGIARADDLVIFVKGMIKDEVADVKIIAEKKNYSFGIIDRLIERSPYRVESDCPVSYKCGGCDYRYIDYDHQLVLKKEVLINTFKDFTVRDIIKDDSPYHYRNKVQIPVREGKMGFYRKFSNDIVEFDDCLIESAKANSIIKDLKRLLTDKDLDKYFRHILIKHAQGSNEIMLGYIVNTFDIDLDEVNKMIIEKYPEIRSIILNLNNEKTNVILGEKEKLLYGRDHIFDEYDGLKVKIALKSFYQVNHDMMLKLYAKIREMADLKGDESLLDLYCGIGTITLYLARYVKQATGVEIVEKAIENARDNAKLNHMNNVSFICADASRKMDEYIKDKDIVIVDPPRKGISKQLIDAFIELKTRKIVYVSCNPATLNRDLLLLKEHYDISEIQPLDMFPYTTHVENVCLLTYKTNLL
ncbi:MAG: 23S rRNA (uracil(1939)-C(5))-methyltransferase RlmD [Erysipelotrichaceae bacterium]|nr:23S rRNA (uracil(1939)-C(5))-methyltransferase RlmD [Erysipelotrichaceae bacterium]